MNTFSYEKNRVINGICEWCGILATMCEHYAGGKQSLPMDEKRRLEISQKVKDVPKAVTGVEIPPLTEEEQRQVPKPPLEPEVVTDPIEPANKV